MDVDRMLTDDIQSNTRARRYRHGHRRGKHMRQYEDSEMLNHQLNSCCKKERVKPYFKLKS